MMGKLKAELFVGEKGIVSARLWSGFTIHAEEVVRLLLALLQVCDESHSLNVVLSFVHVHVHAGAQVFRLAEVMEGFVSKLFFYETRKLNLASKSNN